MAGSGPWAAVLVAPDSSVWGCGVPLSSWVLVPLYVLGNQVLLLLAPVGRSLLDVVGKGYLPSATLTFDPGLPLCPHFLGCLLEAAAFLAALSWPYLVLFPV